jgi:enterochelin esterase-like enzyme
MNRLPLTITLLATLSFFSVSSQPQRRPSVVSPDVHGDHSITFRYYSRTAQRVSVSGEFLKAPMKLQRDTSGIWSVTVPPVKPDIYPYSFWVDSVQVADPNNSYIFANERFKRSIVDIPSDQPLIHSLQNVPHGKVSYEYYQSKTLNTTRTLLVYTPPGFDPNGKIKYPVLYLIHGGSDTEETWMKVGRANLIADNLISQQKAVPMIIVMPYGNVRPKPMADFTRDVVGDIIPFIEAKYPVIRESKGRAVAGFSVGGGQTLNIGLMNADKFAYVCSYAPYTGTEEFKNNFTSWAPDASALNKQLKLFTISVGTEDFLYESVKQNIAMFNEKNLKLETFIVPGGHTWMNCKLFLAKSLQQLFK